MNGIISSHTDPLWRRAQIRRMQFMATGLLVAMAVLFVLTSFLVSRWPALGYLRAFAEAAMIGGCADWFAVVALFRHPLGIPIPHTAIVPNNKDRIGESLGRFVCNNFLAPDIVSGRLEALDLAGRGARWLDRPDNARQLSRWILRLARPVAEALGGQDFGSFARAQIRRAADAVSISPLLLRAAALLKERGYHFLFFDASVNALESFLAKHEKEIREDVAQHSYRWIPRWVDDRLANMLLTALMETVSDLRDPEHPWRGEFETALERLLEQAKADPSVLAGGEQFKNEFLDDPAVQDYFAQIWAQARNRFADQESDEEGSAQSSLTKILLALGSQFSDDIRLQRAANRWVLRLVQRHAIPQRDAIGDFITGIVGKWETQTLVDKLELQVGSDLQYIRLNGTLVGGLVGLVLYVLTVLTQ